MRPIIIFVLLPVLLLFVAFRGHAQNAQATCSGSLGDPVINQDFGSGSNPGPQLAAGFTNMTYTSDNCPSDGYYTIANSLTGSGNCHSGTWHDVPTDHTGNPNGYMMIVNASYTPSVFFTQSADVLCPGTTYQFSAYILNLIELSASNSTVIQPNITFSVETTDGTVLAIDSTGNIPPTQDVEWVQKSLFFTTPNGVSSVVVKMTNNAPGGNGNDLILDDITFRACGPVVQSGFNSVTNTADHPLCAGDYDSSVILQSSVGPGYANPAYQWQENDNNGGWNDLVNATTSSLNPVFYPAVTGTYQYRVAVANAGNITSPNCRVYSDPLTVNVYDNPVVSGLKATQSVCEGDSLVLSASGGASYQWTGPNLPATSTNPLTIKNMSQANAGKYKVIAYSQYSCSAADSTQVTVVPLPGGAVSNSGQTICAGTAITLGASGGVAYSWSPGKTLSDSTSADPVATPTDTTNYTVKIYNQDNCYEALPVTVNVLKDPVANAGPKRVIFEGQSTTLKATEKYGNIFSWTPTTGLSDPNILNPVASPTDDITYTLHVSSTSNCGTDTSSVFVKVYKTITIPNTFSPNRDGFNDTWDIDALVTYPDCSLTVFNRYGSQVYHSIGYNKSWDGKFNGALVPAGTYYYVLDLKNNTPVMSGWLLIVR